MAGRGGKDKQGKVNRGQVKEKLRKKEGKKKEREEKRERRRQKREKKEEKMDKIRQNEKIALFFPKKSALRAICFAVTEGNLRTAAREGGER